MKKSSILGVLSILLLIGFASVASAQHSQPRGVEVANRIRSETSAQWDPKSVDAEAGNITTLTINASSQTKTWQGFVGNISGVITLDDADNYTLYDWKAAEPQGELYATTAQTVTWSSIACWNMSANLATAEANLGLDPNDYDGIDETFNNESHPTIYSGTTTITGCNATKLYTNNAQPANDWWELLLDDGSNNIIYTSIIEDKTTGVKGSKVGFDGHNYDFQMLVGDNGHNGDDVVTTYYFYAELE